MCDLKARTEEERRGGESIERHTHARAREGIAPLSKLPGNFLLHGAARYKILRRQLLREILDGALSLRL